MSSNSFDAKASLEVGGKSYEIFRIDALQSSTMSPGSPSR